MNSVKPSRSSCTPQNFLGTQSNLSKSMHAPQTSDCLWSYGPSASVAGREKPAPMASMKTMSVNGSQLASDSIRLNGGAGCDKVR